MGDVSFWQGGYTLPQTNFGTYRAKDISIGREIFEKFGKKYMSPDEWQGVQDQDQVFAAARNLLTRVIRHARSRNIKVWLAMESLNAFAPNLARYCRRVERDRNENPLPFTPYMATYVCPTDPTVHQINENRFRALIETYPEAEGYIMWTPELLPVCEHAEDRELMEQSQSIVAGLKNQLRAVAGQEAFKEEWVDDFITSGVGAVHLIQKILEVRDRIAPQAKIGAGGWYWGKAYLLQAFDQSLPKDLAYVVGGKSIFAESPTGAFAGMERERIAITELDYDTAMFGLQFHVRLYDRERLIQGAQENGAAGVVPWLNRGPQETEWLSRYFSEGAWNPQLTPEEFYQNYARRVFGERAQKEMFQAFMVFEEKEFSTGRTATHGAWLPTFDAGPNRDMPCCFPPDELRIARLFANQPNPYDGPVFDGWSEFVAGIPPAIRSYSRDVQLLEKGLRHLEAASPVAAPQGWHQLAYLKNRTQAYLWHLKALLELLEGYGKLDQAFQQGPLEQREEFLRILGQSFLRFRQARLLARYAAQEWTKSSDHVSDLGGLYRINTFMVTGTELIADFVENIVNFHHGKPYLKKVAWEKVFSVLPVRHPHPLFP